MKVSIASPSYDEKFIRMRLRRIDDAIEDAVTGAEERHLQHHRKRLLKAHPWLLPYSEEL